MRVVGFTKGGGGCLGVGLGLLSEFLKPQTMVLGSQFLFKDFDNPEPYTLNLKL